MKTSFAFFGLAAALALPTLGSATPMSTMTWNFLNDVPANSQGVAVGASQSFTDTQGNATTILASVDPSIRGFDLFEKKEGGDENGLGVTPESDDEINAGKPGILLNLSSVLALNPSTISLSFGSITDGEIGSITYVDGDHDGDTFSITTMNGSPVNLNLAELTEEGGSILINADRGDVLIAGVTATPEPAAAGLLGIGLLAAGFIGRKRFAKQA